MWDIFSAVRTPKDHLSRDKLAFSFSFQGQISNNVQEGKIALAKLNNSDCLMKCMSFGLDLARIFATISFFF